TRLPNASAARGARGSLASVTDQSRIALIASPSTADPMVAPLSCQFSLTCACMINRRSPKRELCEICALFATKWPIQASSSGLRRYLKQRTCSLDTILRSVCGRTFPAQQCEKFGQHHRRGAPDFDRSEVERRHVQAPSVAHTLSPSNPRRIQKLMHIDDENASDFCVRRN